MRNYFLIFGCLLLIGCGGKKEETLFDRYYGSKCEAMTDIAKYALEIHVNRMPSDFEQIRSESSKDVAKALEVEASSQITDCKDIDAYTKANAKKSQKEVYELALYYFMQRLDSHSMYIPATGAEIVRKQNKNIEYGIGIETKYVHRAIRSALPVDTIILDYVYPRTSAYGKLQAEDEIQSINGQEIKGKTVPEIAKLMLSDKKVVEVKVKRMDEPISIEITEFKKPALYVKKMPNQAFHLIRIPRFSSGIAAELKKTLESLNESGTEGVILDLRGNPGGFVDEGAETVELFLKSSGEIFHTEGSNKSNSIARDFRHQVYEVDGNAIFTKPVVVLVDSDTASIAEAVAGSLKNAGRAVLIGNQTFGKGSVQVDQNISDKSGFPGMLVTTISLLYYQNGDTHQVRRLKPHYELANPRFDDAVSVLKKDNPSAVFYETDYNNIIQPKSRREEASTSENSPTSTIDLGNVEETLAKTCDNIAYQACLETYAVKFLNLLEHDSK